MRIFITGIAGFIGSNLAKKLSENNFYVYGVDNFFSGYKKNISKEIKCIKLDIRNKKSFKKINKKFDIVIHAAAQTCGEKSFYIPAYDLETNIIGSKNTFDFACKCKAKLFINLSTMSIYGSPNKKIKKVNEKFEPKPVSMYGNSKLAAEKTLNILSKRSKIPVINLRIFNAFGPGQDLNNLQQGMVSIYLYYLLKKKKILVKGSLNRVRDFIFVDDVINAIIKIINSKKFKSDTFNLSTNKLTSVKNLINKLKALLKSKKKIVFGEVTPGDTDGFAGDNQKIKNKFKWKPTLSLEKGLLEMIKYYKKR